jgi:hypothetical protein
MYHQLIRIDNGTPVYNIQAAKNLLKSLSNGEYIVSIRKVDPKSDIKDYRACYFAKLDILRHEVGESKEDLHEIIKQYLLFPLLSEIHDGDENVPTLTTKNLDHKGWAMLLERLDLWAFTEYNVILS